MNNVFFTVENSIRTLLLVHLVMYVSNKLDDYVEMVRTKQVALKSNDFPFLTAPKIVHLNTSQKKGRDEMVGEGGIAQLSVSQPEWAYSDRAQVSYA